MADVKWTQNQLNAINARNGAVLVSAAAGSGKTAVLVERVIDMITDSENPVDADRLLVVTYTRAAAGEMRDRIAARLDELLVKDPFNENLHRQQLLLGRASISTIHSFCSELAREYFYTLDIPADFRIAEEQELTIIKQAAIDAVLERKYSENDPIFDNTVEVFSSVRDDKILQDVVLRLYDFLRSHPFPDDWIKEKSAMYNPNLTAAQTYWGKVVIERARMSVLFIKSLNERSIEQLNNEPVLRDSKFGQLIVDDGIFIDLLLKRIEEKDWDGTIHCLGTYNAGRLSAPKGYADNEIKMAVAGCRDIVKETIKEIQSLFFRSDKECVEDIAGLAPVVGKLFEIMLMFSDEYDRMKKERSIADFSDLEHWTLQLLVKNTSNGVVPTETAKEVSNRFDYVMVDEYQDANKIQDTIFKAVSDNDRKLFVVGDVKQSIYRFRQAMPEIFIERKDCCGLYNPNNEVYPAKIILDKNFRSRHGVTQGVNFVFKNLMSTDVGDIDYTGEEELVTGASYDDDGKNAVSFHLLGLSNSDTGDKDIEEARYIGKMIYRMMETEEVTDKQGKRKPRFGDFCILLRGARAHGQTFVQELARLGIPSYSEISESFFEAHEVQVILSLLRIIDNPIQDIPLAAVLLSPIYGFTAEELAQYRVDMRHGSLYSLLLNENKKGNEKTLHFTEELSKLRILSTAVSADEMLNRIYEQTAYPDMVYASEDGDFKRRNLRLLLQYAKNYEQSGYRGLSGFVKFLDRMKENNCDLPAASRQSDANGNAVSIMTIHKSKGLEYPFCIVANLSRKINTDTTNEVLLHNELGLGVRRKDDRNLCRYTTMPRNAVSLEIKRNEMSEELRVLYVAMTRARERLILVASVPNTEKYLTTAAKKLSYDVRVSPYTVSGALCMADWITYCLLVHPCGSLLRNISGYVGDISHEKTPNWDIVVTDELYEYDSTENFSVENSDSVEADSLEVISAAEREDCVNEILHTINARLDVEYEYKKMTEIPVKVTASALTHKDSMAEFVHLSMPDFMKKDGLTGAERGTAMHLFAQYCDFSRVMENAQAELEALVNKGFLTEEQAESVDMERVYAFIHSELMSRMISADSVEREYRFTVEIPAGVANPHLEFPYSEEKIILQGAVDCLFEENGEIVIVDYKTDYAKEIGELTAKYARQLELYKLAIEQTTGLPVKECLIYSFRLGESAVLLS